MNRVIWVTKFEGDYLGWKTAQDAVRGLDDCDYEKNLISEGFDDKTIKFLGLDKMPNHSILKLSVDISQQKLVPCPCGMGHLLKKK